MGVKSNIINNLKSLDIWKKIEEEDVARLGEVTLRIIGLKSRTRFYLSDVYLTVVEDQKGIRFYWNLIRPPTLEYIIQHSEDANKILYHLDILQ